MLELRDPKVLRERVSATQSTGTIYANKGLVKRYDRAWGKANVNATAKLVPNYTLSRNCIIFIFLTRSETPRVRFIILRRRFSRLDAAHFGFQGRARYHTSYIVNRYIRLFRANPVIVGGVVVDDREGSVEVAFLVDENIRDHVQLALEEQLAQIPDPRLS